MRRFLQPLVALAFVAAASPALAQTSTAPAPTTPEPSRPSPGRWEAGVGIGITASRLTGGLLYASGIYLPFQLGAHARLEPSFGFYYTTAKYEGTDPVTTRSKGGNVGLGAFYTWSIDGPTLGYAGVRGGYFHNSSEQPMSVGGLDPGTTPHTATSVTDQSTVTFAAVLGGEAMLTRSFSLGADVSVGMVHAGSPTERLPEGASESRALWSLSRAAETTFSIDAILFARLYLWQLKKTPPPTASTPR